MKPGHILTCQAVHYQKSQHTGAGCLGTDTDAIDTQEPSPLRSRVGLQASVKLLFRERLTVAHRGPDVPLVVLQDLSPRCETTGKHVGTQAAQRIWVTASPGSALQLVIPSKSRSNHTSHVGKGK